MMTDQSDSLSPALATEGKRDSLGKIETYGIDYIAEEHRHSRPRNVTFIMAGSCVTFPLIIQGWVPIALGLSWWASFWAVFLGAVFGAILLVPMSFLSPRTGTNNPMGSAAHFGIIGRIVGSFVGLLISVLFTALAIWTGGDAITASLHNLFGWPESSAMSFFWYTVLTIAVIAVAVYGHATMLFLQKYSTWIAGGILIVGIFVYAGNFDPGYSGGELALGNFWATWFAGFIPSALVVVGFSLAIGDWTRYISAKKHSNLAIGVATFIGGVVGQGGPVMWGAFTASTFADPTADYVTTLVAATPLWFVPFLFILGLASGASQGVVNMYSTGLDLSSIFPKLSRVPGTVGVGIAAYALVIVGIYSGAIIDNMTAFLDFLTIGFVSFVIVVIIGYWHHRGQYDSDALQVVVRGEKGGRYWFFHGWNWRATSAFIIASVLGSLGVADAWMTGPFVSLMGGASLGFLISLVVGAVVYVGLLYVFPEDPASHASGRPRIWRRSAKYRLAASDA